MSSNNKIAHRSIASLKLPHRMAALIPYVEGIIAGMTGNPTFPNPSPPLASVTTALDDLQTAEALALTRAKGAAATRNQKRATLVSLLEQLRTYVQSVADASPENGPAIIESARLAVRKTPVRAPRVFAAKLGTVSGTVTLVVPSAARRASYEWQYSTDGGKTWVDMPPTLQAKTTLGGLTALSTVDFRYRAVIKGGAQNWSAPISVVVK
jgi:hypothetical protein